MSFLLLPPLYSKSYVLGTFGLPQPVWSALNMSLEKLASYATSVLFRGRAAVTTLISPEPNKSSLEALRHHVNVP